MIEIKKSLILEEYYIREFTEICSGAFSIYVVFLCLCNEKGKIKRATVTIEELCKYTGFSLAKVVRVLRNLENAGLIKRDNKEKGVKKTYFLCRQ
jgi:Fe2+ or Zn2+ uptake regulation protein